MNLNLTSEITAEDLGLLIQLFSSLSTDLYHLNTQIEEVEGVLDAIDLALAEKVHLNSQALKLTNDSLRKLYKNKLQSEHPKYSELQDRLQELKREKALQGIEREKARQELEVGKLQFRSQIVSQETENLSVGIGSM